MVGVHAEDGSQVRPRALNSFTRYYILEPTQPNERYVRLARESGNEGWECALMKKSQFSVCTKPVEELGMHEAFTYACFRACQNPVDPVHARGNNQS